MMTAQGDAVLHVQTKPGEKDDGQDVMCLQVALLVAASARTIARSHGRGPLLARSALPKSLFGAAVYVVRVVLANVQFRKDSGLGLPPFARFRTAGTVSVSVVTGLVDAPADLARKPAGSGVGKRLVYRVQNALIPANGPDVSAEIPAGLEMGAEGAVWFGHHIRVRLPARLTAELCSDRVPSTPATILSDHRSSIRRPWSVSP